MEHNPYAPPASSMFQGVETDGYDSQPSTERDLRIFVGSKAGYYLSKWSPALFDSERVTGFNWLAFLFAGIWLPYRKMYRVTFLLYGFWVVETIGESIIEGLSPGSAKAIEGFGGILGLGVAIFIGVKANAWYLDHANKIIAETRAQGLPDDTYKGEIARRGGSSLGAGFGLFFLLFVTFVVIGLVSGFVMGEFSE